MKTQIIIHLLPHEIDWFEWQSKQLKIGSAFLEKKDNIIIDVTLNLNLVNWGKSNIPKEYFINKFSQIKQYFDWCEILFDINEDNTCLGIDDKRRSSIRQFGKNVDNFIYLDCDLIFKPETLKYLIDSSEYIQKEYYIISPQIPKIWDNTWDILVNDVYLSEDNGFEKTFNPYDVLNTDYGEISIHDIPVFKFGGGWFNLISSKLLQLTDIPDSFGSYGIDDTYVMFCCELMKKNTNNIPQQYVINNLVVAENYKYRNNPYIDFLNIIDRKNEFKKQAESNFQIELNKFYEKFFNIYTKYQSN
jgi:hypothetical protein